MLSLLWACVLVCVVNYCTFISIELGGGSHWQQQRTRCQHVFVVAAFHPGGEQVQGWVGQESSFIEKLHYSNTIVPV